MAFRRRDYAAAEKAYGEYFAKNQAPASNNPEDIDEFTRCVRNYKTALEQQGKGKEAQKAIELLARIECEDRGTSDRQMAFMKVQTLLNAEDEKYSNQEPVDTKAIEAAIKALEKLPWEALDGVAAASFPESARALILIGQEDKAIEILKTGEPLMVQIEEAMVKSDGAGARAASPIASSLYYYGRALKGKALKLYKAGKKDEAKTQLVESAKRFYLCVDEYGKSSYKTKSAVEYSKCQNLLEKEFGVKIKDLPDAGGGVVEIAVQKAAPLLGAGKFAAALPVLEQGARASGSRRASNFPELGVRLVLCYANTGRFLEGEAICSYLADLFPKAEETPDALLKLGIIIYQKARDEKDPAKQALYEDQAIRVLDRFVDSAPTHNKAPDIAFMVAETYYKSAADLARATTSMPDGREKEERKREARDAYQRAIPFYTRLVDKFSAFDKGVRALYKLGWVYDAVNQPKDSIDAFLRYCEVESNPEHSDDRLQAKFRAAATVMTGDSPADAVEHFNELLSWLEPDNRGGFNVKTETAKRIKEDAASYLAWSYDLAGERYRGQMNEFNDATNKAQMLVRQAQAVLAEAEGTQKLAEAGAEDAKNDFSEMEKLFALAGQDADAEARRLAAERQEKTAGMSEEEKRQVEANVAEEVRRIREAWAKGAKDRLSGEKLQYEMERDEVKKRKDANATQQQGVEKELTDTRKNLDEAKTKKGVSAGQLEKLEDRLRAARKGVDQAEEESRTVRSERDKLQEMADSVDADVRKKAPPALLRKAETAVEAVEKKLRDAHAVLEEVTKPDEEKKRADLTVEVAQLTAQIQQGEVKLRKLEREKLFLEKDADWFQARLVAAAKMLDRNQQEALSLASGAAEAKAEAEAKMKALVGECLAAFRDVMEKRIAKAVSMQTAAKEDMALARQRIAEAEEQVKAVEVARKPVQDVFDGWKRKAVAHFSKFLASYSQSKHVPDNMARLGAIHLEFRENDKAQVVLAELIAKFPKAEAGRRALFSLGQAQYENNQGAKAAETFEDLLEKGGDIDTPNLAYISEKMLDGGFPKVSYEASKLLLVRSEDKNHKDYELLKDKAREPTLFRAAEACFRLEDYTTALALYQKLLEERPSSGYFFECKFQMSGCKQRLSPPDFDGALADLAEVFTYARTPGQQNKASCYQGATLVRQGEAAAQKGDKGKLKETLSLALARYLLVVRCADIGVPENKPWIEEAIYQAARIHARLGMDKERDELIKLYREKFPTGKYSAQIGKLPPAEFTPDAAPGAAGPKK
jgi:TolA-binding protein